MQANHPKIREIIYVAPQKDWRFPLHEHRNSAELSLLLAGKGELYSMNQTCIVTKGMLIAKNAGLSHAEKSDATDPMEQICIEIEDVHLDGLAENQVIPEGMHPVLELDDVFAFAAAGFQYLRNHFQNPDSADICNHVLSAILALLQQKVRQHYQAHSPKQNSAGQNLDLLITYLDRHYREKIRIRDLARQFYMSEGHLSRLFKKKTGYTVNEYIINKRMGEAQRLLLFDQKDIKEIASLCGYDDIQYFYHVFRKTANCTPVEFREKYH